MSGSHVHLADGYAAWASQSDDIERGGQARAAARQGKRQLVGQPQYVYTQGVTQSPIVDELMEIVDRRIHRQFAVHYDSHGRPGA